MTSSLNDNEVWQLQLNLNASCNVIRTNSQVGTAD